MNELLRFKAATDDYPMALGNEAAHRSVVGIFGGVGEASDAVRSHAYLQGGAGPLTAMGKPGSTSCCPGRREVGLPRLLMFSENVLAN